jgi:hypothetical protein
MRIKIRADSARFAATPPLCLVSDQRRTFWTFPSGAHLDLLMSVLSQPMFVQVAARMRTLTDSTRFCRASLLMPQVDTPEASEYR